MVKGNRALSGPPECEDSVSGDQCQEDRGQCNQFTEAGQKMEVMYCGTCGTYFTIKLLSNFKISLPRSTPTSTSTLISALS